MNVLRASGYPIGKVGFHTLASTHVSCSDNAYAAFDTSMMARILGWSLGYDRALREEERTHAEELALWGMPTLACHEVLSLPYRHVNCAVHCPLRT